MLRQWFNRRRDSHLGWGINLLAVGTMQWWLVVPLTVYLVWPRRKT